MSSHALKLVHLGSLGVGGICSCPDGCDWDTGTEWRETVGQVEDDHGRHIEEVEAPYWRAVWLDYITTTEEEQADG